MATLRANPVLADVVELLDCPPPPPPLVSRFRKLDGADLATGGSRRPRTRHRDATVNSCLSDPPRSSPTFSELLQLDPPEPPDPPESPEPPEPPEHPEPPEPSESPEPSEPPDPPDSLYSLVADESPSSRSMAVVCSDDTVFFLLFPRTLDPIDSEFLQG